VSLLKYLLAMQCVLIDLCMLSVLAILIVESVIPVFRALFLLPVVTCDCHVISDTRVSNRL